MGLAPANLLQGLDPPCVSTSKFNSVDRCMGTFYCHFREKLGRPIGILRGEARGSCEGLASLYYKINVVRSSPIPRKSTAEMHVFRDNKGSLDCFKVQYKTKELRKTVFDFIVPISLQLLTHQAPVVQRLDNAIQQINRYPVDKC